MKLVMKAACFALAFAPCAAMAHAALEVPEARQNSGYKAVVKIGHGCEGTATHTVRVNVPEGVIAAKPMPKAGWKLETETGDYARTYDYFGRPMNRGVRTITWSGGKLADSEYDEFVFTARITDAVPQGTLYIPVTQICEKGSHAWTEIPGPGQDAHALKSPAPALRITAAVVQMAQMGGHGAHTGAASQGSANGLAFTAPWTRATPPGSKVAGGFFTVENKGGAEDRLIGGTSEVSNLFEVHEMAMEQGVMKMRALAKGLPVPPGGKVELKPGSYHIMFLDLKRPLKEGESFKAELQFEKAGKVPVEFKVMPIGARDGGGHTHH